MKFIDLFAGLGGFHVALGKLGHKCVFASEIDGTLRSLVRAEFPHGSRRRYMRRKARGHTSA